MAARSVSLKHRMRVRLADAFCSTNKEGLLASQVDPCSSWEAFEVTGVSATAGGKGSTATCGSLRRWLRAVPASNVEKSQSCAQQNLPSPSRALRNSAGAPHKLQQPPGDPSSSVQQDAADAPQPQQHPGVQQDSAPVPRPAPSLASPAGVGSEQPPSLPATALPATPPPSQRPSGDSPDGTPTPRSSQASRRSHDQEHANQRSELPGSPDVGDGAGGFSASEGLHAPPTEPGTLKTIATESVKELKARLIEHGIDVRGCMERSELEALWNQYARLCSEKLPELRERCAAMGDCGLRLPRRSTVEECARFLCTQSRCAWPSPSAVGTSWCVGASPPAPAVRASDEGSARERAAAAEIARILPLRKDAYRTLSDWGAAVLRCGRLQHSHAFRELMRVLHPDRIGASRGAAEALEMVKEARAHCERACVQVRAPCAPPNLTARELCREPGRRRILVEWGAGSQAPRAMAAPVKRYIISVFDPAYGRALKVAVLEPDYSEELRRFVPLEELRSYILDEQHLRKMPTVFQQASVTVQVAAANEAGQSEWAVLQVPLRRGPLPGSAWHR